MGGARRTVDGAAPRGPFGAEGLPPSFRSACAYVPAPFFILRPPEPWSIFRYITGRAVVVAMTCHVSHDVLRILSPSFFESVGGLYLALSGMRERGPSNQLRTTDRDHEGRRTD